MRLRLVTLLQINTVLRNLFNFKVSLILSAFPLNFMKEINNPQLVLSINKLTNNFCSVQKQSNMSDRSFVMNCNLMRFYISVKLFFSTVRALSSLWHWFHVSFQERAKSMLLIFSLNFLTLISVFCVVCSVECFVYTVMCSPCTIIFLVQEFHFPLLFFHSHFLHSLSKYFTAVWLFCFVFAFIMPL